MMTLFVGTERDFANRIPLTFYPLLIAYFAGLLLPASLDVAQFGWVSNLAIMGVFIFGLVLRIWGSSILTSDIVMDREAHADLLITHGPFAYIRHPLYTGAGFMLAAMAVFLPVAVAVPFWIYEGWIGLRLATYEENLMKLRFGDKYRHYMEQTGRYLPRIFVGEHLSKSRSEKINFREAVASEFVFVIYGILLAVGLYTGNRRLFLGGVIIGSVVGALIVKKMVKQAKV
jgi:protein-S-isoprenylcysteine O-methyltransferase Ste14